MNELETKAAKQAAVIYTIVSLVITLIFLLITYIDGKTYTAVARIGGMIWVFILSMIVAMPIVIPAMKRKMMS